MFQFIKFIEKAIKSSDVTQSEYSFEKLGYKNN